MKSRPAARIGLVMTCQYQSRFFPPAFLRGATRFLAITYSKILLAFLGRPLRFLALVVAFWRLSVGLLSVFRRRAGGKLSRD